jgi:DNA excision repair protein ERCC-8
MAVAADADMVFHPSGSVIQCLGLQSGIEHSLLKGHLDTVNCCCFNSSTHELYSGSNDCNIITWGPPEDQRLPELAEGPERDTDAWSD